MKSIVRLLVCSLALVALGLGAPCLFAQNDPCTLPGLTVLNDPANDELLPGASNLDIESVSIAELSGDTDKLTFTMKVGDLSTLPPNCWWTVFFGEKSFSQRFVQMETSATGAASFYYGFYDEDLNSYGRYPNPPEASYKPDGTIQIKVPLHDVFLQPGAKLEIIRARTSVILFAEVKTDETANAVPANPSYTLRGNSSCGQQPTPTPTATIAPTPTATPTATPSPTPSPTPVARLLNISTRLRVLTGNNALIAGFILTGSDPKKVGVRAMGPSLPLNGTLANPMLDLHNSQAVIASNDNWKINGQTGQSQEVEVRNTGLAPASDLESFVLATLPANTSNYTAIVSGKNGGTGVGLVEVYDLAQGADSQLANISTRGFVETGDYVMIGGFISGNGSGSSRIIVRGMGPSLGINGALQDPTLEIHDHNGTAIMSNDNWQDDPQASEVQAAGVAPKDPRESAIYAILPAAAYTTIVKGRDNTTGIGLVEIYNLQ